MPVELHMEAVAVVPFKETVLVPWLLPNPVPAMIT
jgi:hypothetical protein